MENPARLLMNVAQERINAIRTPTAFSICSKEERNGHRKKKMFIIDVNVQKDLLETGSLVTK